MPRRMVCVYRSGGDFTPDYVARLVGAFRRYHVGPDWETVCLTDDAIGVSRGTPRPDRIEILRYNFPSWWSKMEVFGVEGPCIYLDLDTLIFGDLSPLLETPGKAICFLRDLGHRPWPETGVMAWGQSHGAIFDAFLADAVRGEFRQDGAISCLVLNGHTVRGDGAWLRTYLEGVDLKWGYVQDSFPAIASFKLDRLKMLAGPPADARIVCFHGKPRPHEVIDRCAWVRDYWEQGIGETTDAGSHR